MGGTPIKNDFDEPIKNEEIVQIKTKDGFKKV
jgi:hypothetical protein